MEAQYRGDKRHLLSAVAYGGCSHQAQRLKVEISSGDRPLHERIHVEDVNNFTFEADPENTSFNKEAAKLIEITDVLDEAFTLLAEHTKYALREDYLSDLESRLAELGEGATYAQKAKGATSYETL